MASLPLLELSCAVQNYAWGKHGSASEVAQLKSKDPSFLLNEQEPYAELWMGTHAKGPSIISSPASLSGVPLSKWISDNPSCLGDAVMKEFNGNLPFLFKVLSINKALSIQAHPTKEHACSLHSTFPQHYPDPNHKPEMVIALNDFEGLCGFRHFEEIQYFIQNIPELQEVLGKDVVSKMSSDSTCTGTDQCKIVLKNCFTALMNQDPSIVKRQLDRFQERLKEERKMQNGSNAGVITDELCDIFLRLCSWYPGDVGCWCLFYLNYFRLNKEQSLFLAPNEPHAYISGDVIECMACSDNVVRAGLTPKFKDKDTLTSMLSYSMKTPMETLFLPKPHPTLEDALVYDPPTPEFTVVKVTVNGRVCLPAIVGGASIIIIISGEGMLVCDGSEEINYKKGSIYFVSENNNVNINSNDNTVLYQAYCQM